MSIVTIIINTVFADTVKTAVRNTFKHKIMFGQKVRISQTFRQTLGPYRLYGLCRLWVPENADDLSESVDPRCKKFSTNSGDLKCALLLQESEASQPTRQ